MSSKEVVWTAQTNAQIADLEWSPDSQWIASASLEGVSLWKANTGQKGEDFPSITHKADVISFNRDGTKLAYVRDDIYIEIVNIVPPCNYSPSNPSELIVAIQTANGTSEADNICLAQNGTYTFAAVHNNSFNAVPRITTDIKIIGNGATLTRGASAPMLRFFDVRSNGKLTLDNLTLSGGNIDDDEDGGAIYNIGTLEVNHVTFSNNHAGVGGAIASEAGNVTVMDSTFTGNSADDAGAVNNDAGTLTVTNSTFTENTGDAGGAIE